MKNGKKITKKNLCPPWEIRGAQAKKEENNYCGGGSVVYSVLPPTEELFVFFCCGTRARAESSTAAEAGEKKTMAEILIGGLAWGALKLTSSLVSAGFKKLIGADEDAAMVEWSGDVVVKAREKSHQQQALVSSGRSPDMAPFSRALEGHQHAVSASGIEGFALLHCCRCTRFSPHIDLNSVSHVSSPGGHVQRSYNTQVPTAHSSACRRCM